MKQKKITTIAVISGVACALCVVLFMVNVQGQANEARAEALARYGGEQVEVCVATRDIASGERLDHSAVETKLWVAGLLPDGAMRNSADVVGQVATSSILKGEVVTEGRFKQGKETFDIPTGKQAVSVPVKAVQAVGGTVRPGMSVNVYASGDTTTSILASNVVVLDTSVGDSGTLSASESGWITLAIDSGQVQEVIAASSKTSLYFVIPGDQIDESSPVDQSNEQGEVDEISQVNRTESPPFELSRQSVSVGQDARSAEGEQSDRIENALDAPSVKTNQTNQNEQQKGDGRNE